MSLSWSIDTGIGEEGGFIRENNLDSQTENNLDSDLSPLTNLRISLIYSLHSLLITLCVKESCQTVSAQTYLWTKHFFNYFYPLVEFIWQFSLSRKKVLGFFSCESGFCWHDLSQ